MSMSQTSSQQCQKVPPHLGKKSMLAWLPADLIPYAELMRLHKPVGILNIYLPYLLASLFAADVKWITISPRDLIRSAFILFAAAFILRSVGCSWNDIIDRDLDKHVQRCKSRPMVRGAISERNGYAFCAAQLCLWLLVLSRGNATAFMLALPIIGLAAFYPFAKRVTAFPQVVLAVTLSWGCLVGAAHTGGPFNKDILKHPETIAGLAFLFLSYSTWTVIHDTIYAFQDLKDDKKVGIKSMAVAYQSKSVRMLAALSIIQIVLLYLVGVCIDATPVYFLLACGGTGTMLILMVLRLNVNDPKECLWWFENGSILFGALVSLSLIQDYVIRNL